MNRMKIIKLILAVQLISISIFSQQPTAKEIVKKAYDLTQGLTNESYMRMSIVRPTWQRTIAFHSWAKGRDLSLVIVTDPAKEKGQTFLKRKNEIWNWVPTIQRMIKLPPSMMSQGWMGSDFTNDDLLKAASIVEDYDHTMLGTELCNEMDCYKIKLVPKPNAAIVWGSLIKWISKKGYLQMKTEFYDEDKQLVKTESASNVKNMGDRDIPTHFEIIPFDKPGNKTIVDLDKVTFNKPMEDEFFSQQNMKIIR
jgi:outer membrane lipoprotein-sorting protein